VQLGDHPGVVLTGGSAAVDQDPQQRKLLIVDHRSKTCHPWPAPQPTETGTEDNPA
jgi:hypothetical protein